ncbi:cytochrome c oxidase subunit II [Mangrovibacillus sp. Mu-81]|jgi:cytochrome c oxidase subunit II|uniref:cytochrome c oxidase subunit II n=1 Tax=Mangrovibacillus sp. Mu-81 TaxID=3121478 RepID=UPI002FE43CF7
MRHQLYPVFFLTVLLLSGCKSLQVLDTKGPVAKLQENLILLSTGIMLLVFIIVFSMFVIFTWKYRETPQRRDIIPSYVKGNKKLEIAWTVIPIVLLLILAVPTVQGTFSLADSQKEQDGKMEITVTGHQYWWEFEYNDQGVTLSNEVWIPVDTPVVFNLKSDDVIHSFWVPRLGGKKDLNPGGTNRLTLHASETGVYEGKCAELCGASHSLMRFKVHAVSKERYDQWISEKAEGTARETAASDSYEKGKKLFTSNCLSCHAADYTDKSEGPNLAGIGRKEMIASVVPNNEQNMKKWIEDPKSFKPGAEMPGFKELSDEELEALSNYLSQLE